VNGISATPLTPSLAAQPAVYVSAQLAQFVAGKRPSDVMAPMAKSIAPGDVRALAEALEKLPPPPAPSPVDEATYQRGKGVAQRDQCDTCHQPDFSGIDNAPRLAHQREDYLAKALGDFKSKLRLGYGEPVMPSVAAGLSDAEIRAVAHYLAHFTLKVCEEPKR
jgi:cytochrome c553